MPRRSSGVKRSISAMYDWTRGQSTCTGSLLLLAAGWPCYWNWLAGLDDGLIDHAWCARPEWRRGGVTRWRCWADRDRLSGLRIHDHRLHHLGVRAWLIDKRTRLAVLWKREHWRVGRRRIFFLVVIGLLLLLPLRRHKALRPGHRVRICRCQRPRRRRGRGRRCGTRGHHENAIVD